MKNDKRVFPSHRYHIEHGSKIIHSQEEHDEHEAEGWVDSPAKFNQPKVKPTSKKAPAAEKPKFDEPTEPDGETEETGEEELSDDGEAEETAVDLDGDLSEKSVKQLCAILKEMGAPKKEYKGKSKEELIKLIEGE